MRMSLRTKLEPVSESQSRVLGFTFCKEGMMRLYTSVWEQIGMQ